jgi:hypothetical protein
MGLLPKGKSESAGVFVGGYRDKKTSCITYVMTALNTLLRLHQPEAVRVSA